MTGQVLAPTPSWIPDEEAALIRFQLTLSHYPREVKGGLQRLCGFYDNGWILRDTSNIHQLLIALLWHIDVLVRRWVYKALSYIGRPDDELVLVSRLRDEVDAENQTWGISALVFVARNRKLEELCDVLGMADTAALRLAARFRGKSDWIRDDLIQIDVESADPLTLKWSSLLEGYGRAPEGMYKGRYANDLVLPYLNAHDLAEVAEYSIWALWKNAKYGIGNLALKDHSYVSQPPNVRRWINRLLTKDGRGMVGQTDLLEDLWHDEDQGAREGLALGLRQAFNPQLAAVIQQWFSVEESGAVRKVLLEHMAFNADLDRRYFEMAVSRFRAEVNNDELRKRLLAASAGNRLYPALRQIEAEEAAITARLLAGVDLFGPQVAIYQPTGDFLLSGNKFEVGRDINAGILSGGDTIASTANAVNNLGDDRRGDKDYLESVLEFLRVNVDIPEVHRTQIAQAVSGVAADASDANKGKLLGALRSAAAVVGAGAGLLGQFDHLIEGAVSLFS